MIQLDLIKAPGTNYIFYAQFVLTGHKYIPLYVPLNVTLSLSLNVPLNLLLFVPVLLRWQYLRSLINKHI